MSLYDDFLMDSQGRQFSDVVNDPRIPWRDVTLFFEDPARQARMEHSETYHGRPALAGVVLELEALPAIDHFFMQDGHKTTRFRQAVGVLVRIVMTQRGWRKTGKKGSLGVRANVPPRTTTPGAYHNTGGLAFWFTRAERYEHDHRPRYRLAAERAREFSARAA